MINPNNKEPKQPELLKNLAFPVYEHEAEFVFDGIQPNPVPSQSKPRARPK